MTMPRVERFPDRELAIKTEALEVRYGGHEALAGVDLSVPRGAFYLLAGANGAGKTTSLTAVLDLPRRRSGRVTVLGADARHDGSRVRASIGWVPDSVEWLPSRETAGLFLAVTARYFPSWDEAYAGELVRRFDVSLSRRCGELSRGEARRVQLVAAMAHRPPLLLLDEPFEGLDPVGRDDCLAALGEHLADSPATVVVTTHHVGEIDSMVDTVGVLRSGRLVAQATREAMAESLLDVRLVAREGEPDLEGLEVVGREARGREHRLTVWGTEASVRERLAATEVELTTVRPLRLEAAVRAWLQEEAP